MPLAVTHFVITVIIFTLFRDSFIKNKKDFPIHYVFIGGLAGLLPDIDIAVYWIAAFFNYSFVEFSHNFVFLFSFLALAFITKPMKDFKFRNAKISYYKFFLVVFFAVLIHLILDASISGAITIFYPFTSLEIGYNIIDLFPENLKGLFFPTLDAILLLFWISYLEWKHKISSFF